MRLFDTHCHLNDKAFDEDLDEVLKRAEEAGVYRMLVVGFNLPSSERAAEMSEEHSAVYAAAGIHPHDAEDVSPADLEVLRRLLRMDKVKALGEVGLDYYYEYSPRNKQKNLFRSLLEMAREVGKPVIIHDREAHGDILKILKDAGREYRGVMHCYSGSAEMVREFLDLGFHISVAGPVTFTNAKKLPEVVRAVPEDRLLLETDSPYLTPHPFRGKRNEPFYLREIAKKVGEIRGVSPEDMAAITWENACRLFNID